MKFHQRYLLKQLIKQDIQQRYKGSVLGMVWSFMTPIFMLIIYTFVFSEIFQAKWEIDTNDKYEFAMVLFCGLSAFNMIAEVMNRSTSLVKSHINYVKKVIFPLELLPIVIVSTALFNCVISYIILTVAKLVLYRTISFTMYQILFCFIPLILLSLGMGYIISSFAVYLKDLENLISIIVTLLMYGSPVFFSISALPERFRFICEVNPLTYIIENFRRVALYNQNLDIKTWGISTIVSGVICVGGYSIFKRVKGGFADVL